MSAQPYEAEPQGPGLAQPAVDILPAAAPRRARAAEEPAPVPTAEQDWQRLPVGEVNPWTGAPAPAAPAPVAATVELAQTTVPDVDAVPDDDRPDARRFLGLQLRRGRKGEAEARPEPVHTFPQAPVAAWPTDLGGAVVANAEPVTAYTYAPAPELPAAQAPEPDAAPTAALVEAVDVAVPVVVPAAPAPSPTDDEVRALKALLQSSETQRAAAESRADQAVAYAQQTQAELHQHDTAAAAKVQAVEARARTLANEAQDWQIRHREAEAQIAELVQSVAGAEARLAELRNERDELMAALEDATRPDTAQDVVRPEARD